MKDNSLYELTVDNKQLTILNKALSNYICWQYDGIDLDIVDIPTTTENIKVAQDMKAVINYQLGKTRHTPKQTSQHTWLVWCKEIDLEEKYQNELDSFVEYSEMCLDTFLKNQHTGGK